jgi:mannosyltransferase OCH1-like enzyme
MYHDFVSLLREASEESVVVAKECRRHRFWNSPVLIAVAVLLAVGLIGQQQHLSKLWNSHRLQATELQALSMPSDQLFPTLHELTTSSDQSMNGTCPVSRIWIGNRIPNSMSSTPNIGKIPRVIHQTSKSRCVTPGLVKSIEQWNVFIEEGGWSYYFHDDEAVDKLLSLDYPEFPQLKLVASACLKGQGTSKSDLWRYVVLWVYGGLYADLDTVPNYQKFNGSNSITAEMEGYFVVEYYHLLSQYFMVMEPRHPLMFYAIQKSLHNLVGQPSTQNMDAPLLTGPHALHAGYLQFRKDAGVDLEYDAHVSNGTYYGTRNKTVTAAGLGQDYADELIIRESIDRDEKSAEYTLMGMRHFMEPHAEFNQTQKSCFHMLYHELHQESR